MKYRVLQHCPCGNTYAFQPNVGDIITAVGMTVEPMWCRFCDRPSPSLVMIEWDKECYIPINWLEPLGDDTFELKELDTSLPA